MQEVEKEKRDSRLKHNHFDSVISDRDRDLEFGSSFSEKLLEIVIVEMSDQQREKFGINDNHRAQFGTLSDSTRKPHEQAHRAEKEFLVDNRREERGSLRDRNKKLEEIEPANLDFPHLRALWDRILMDEELAKAIAEHIPGPEEESPLVALLNDLDKLPDFPEF